MQKSWNHCGQNWKQLAYWSPSQLLIEKFDLRLVGFLGLSGFPVLQFGVVSSVRSQ